MPVSIELKKISPGGNAVGSNFRILGGKVCTSKSELLKV